MRSTPFLASLATKVIAQYQQDASQLTLVFPNKRSGLFFLKYLRAQLQTPMFLPQVLEIDDLVACIAHTNRPDELQLVAWLYEVFEQVMGHANHTDAESFADFYPWGQMMLADFVELDKQLVEPEQIFTTIQDQKELDSFYGDLLTEAQKQEISTIWGNIQNTKSSDQKEKFLRIWRALPLIYSQFNHKLSRQGYATEGYQYRSAVSSLGQWLTQDTDRRFWFVGINDLTKSEERIIAQMVEAELATIIWDTDQELLRPNAWLEAGLFQRRYLMHPVLGQTFDAVLPQHLVPPTDSDIKVPEVIATAVSLVVGQAKLLPQLIATEMARLNDQSKLAILLPDPGMLFTVLNSLPKTVTQLNHSGQLTEQPLLVNVSMGYPFRQTPLYSLLYHLIEAQKSSRMVKEQVCFYHDYVLAIIQHPYIVVGNGEAVAEIANTITSQNLIYVPQDLLAGWPIGKLLFRQLRTSQEIFDFLNALLVELSRQLLERNPDNASMEDEYLYRAMTTLTRFESVVQAASIALEIDLFWQMLRQLLDQIKLPFAGEPLEGLQILGMLESRNLDFESVIIVGANEGLLPKLGAHGSFIPYNLRRTFGLSTHNEQDAAQAYLFYRLLFGAKRVNLLYNAESTEQIKGEPSRYFYQLHYGLQWPVRQQVLASQVQQLPVHLLNVSSTPAIRAKIRNRFTVAGEGVKTLDPSAISTLLDCKLKFYLRQIGQVYGSEAVTEEAQTNAVGQLLHHSMEWIYLQLRAHKDGSRVVEATDLPWLKSRVTTALEHALPLENYPPTIAELRGQLLIIVQVVQYYVHKLLELDAAYAPFEILELETESNQDPWLLTIQAGDGTTDQFRLGGRIDRIDRKDGNIRIMDYKTGKADQKAESLVQVFGKDEKKKSLSAIYQTIHYTHLFGQRNPALAANHKLVPGIISLRNCFTENYDMGTSPQILIGKDNPVLDYQRQYAQQFKAEVQSLLTELMDPEMVFSQTENLNTCIYCDYKTLCQR